MSLPESAPEAVPAAAAAPPIVDPREGRKGVAAALAAYLLWGFLPLLFRALDSVGSVLIVAERTLWSLVLLAVVVFLTKRFGEVREFFRDRRKVGVMALSSVLLAVN